MKTSYHPLQNRAFFVVPIALNIGLPLFAFIAFTASLPAVEPIPAPGSKLAAAEDKVITQQVVTAEKVGSSIPVSAIGEPVSAVRLSPPQWNPANGGYATVDGSILPVDTNCPPINFRVILPAKWSRRGAQLGGGGMNGSIPMLTRNDLLAKGFATYGSDSGHQMGGFGGKGYGHADGRAGWPWRWSAGRGARRNADGRIWWYGNGWAWQHGDGRRCGRCLGHQRGGNPQSRLYADEEDPRRRHGHNGTRLWRTSALQLLLRRLARRQRSPDRSAALSRGL